MASKMIEVSGVLEVTEKGHGFLRDAARHYRAHAADPLVPSAVIRKYGLRPAVRIDGRCHANNRRPPEVAVVEQVEGLPPDHYAEVTPIQEGTAIDPREHIRFETPGGPLSMRVIDLLTPIGKGQRGLIVAPPRTGKTVLLQQIAAGIARNHPELFMMVLLIDERPEEVTEMRRTVHGEVVASSNDLDYESHVRVARLMTERAKRLVESGREVLVLLDSITRLGRAFNAYVGTSGRTMSGGVDIRALTEPKSMFGSARNIEGGGSLTIIGTALIETGSRMDDLIFNEFKGTGNMEIVLSRELANRRLWPAISLSESGTRKEELLLSPKALKVSTRIRRGMSGRDPIKDMESVLQMMGKYESNEKMLAAQAD